MLHAAPWQRRLLLPAYGIGEAARYARTRRQTVAYWHKGQTGEDSTLSARQAGARLSYLQLIEVAVVAVMREEGLKLSQIRDARRYVQQTFRCEFPFASYRFRTDGKSVLADFEQFDPVAGEGKLLIADKHGQLAWKEILLGRFSEFEYEDDLAARWRPAGPGKPIIIDPRIAFGAPMIRGVPTWALSGRFRAGESLDEIAYDFGLDVTDVVEGLRFEEVEVEPAAVH